MRNIKTRYLWLGVFALFIIAVGLIVGCSYADKTLNKILIVFLAIDFILLTILIQYASYRSFKYKPKLKKLPHKDYECNIDMEAILNKHYEARKVEYGTSYLRIDGKTAYKVNIITDAEAYFNPKDTPKAKPNKALDKCSKLIGIEIFESPSEDILNKLPDFSMQGDKVYYTALAKYENTYSCVNYLEPSEVFSEFVAKLYNELGLIEVSQIIENIE